MDFNTTVSRIKNDANDCLTFIIPTGTSKQQIKDYIIEVSKSVLISEKKDFDRIRVLGGLLHIIDTRVFYSDVSEKPYVFYTTMYGSEYTNTGFTTLPEDNGPVEICHKWGNYPAFDMIEDLLNN